jgi:hypothetical protein
VKPPSLQEAGTANSVESANVSVPLVKRILARAAPPTLVARSVLNVAMPPLAATLVPPESDQVPVPVSTVATTVSVLPVSVLPY